MTQNKSCWARQNTHSAFVLAVFLRSRPAHCIPNLIMSTVPLCLWRRTTRGIRNGSHSLVLWHEYKVSTHRIVTCEIANINQEKTTHLCTEIDQKNASIVSQTTISSPKLQNSFEWLTNYINPSILMCIRQSNQTKSATSTKFLLANLISICRSLGWKNFKQ